jgi:hypothetical protein
MTTTRRFAFVSLTLAMTTTLALGACARATSRPELAISPREPSPVAIRFDNQATEHVHVYVIGAKRQWLLGRVEPGAVALLWFPGQSLDEYSSFVRLAVLTGERVTLQAARNPRARMTIAQPGSEIVSQHWRFAQGQLTSLAR